LQQQRKTDRIHQAQSILKPALFSQKRKMNNMKGNPINGPATDVMIKKIFSTKNVAKNGVFGSNYC
jgi:hypothetical protein